MSAKNRPIEAVFVILCHGIGICKLYIQTIRLELPYSRLCGRSVRESSSSPYFFLLILPHIENKKTAQQSGFFIQELLFQIGKCHALIFWFEKRNLEIVCFAKLELFTKFCFSSKERIVNKSCNTFLD